MPEYIDFISINDLKVDQILYSKLSPKQAIKVAQDFHDKHGLVGVVNTDIGSLRFDESHPLKYVFNNIFGKRIWKVKVYFSEYGSYSLFVDDELGEVIAYYDGDFMGFIENGVFSDYRVKPLNDDDCQYYYPCYLNKTDYDDPDNVSRLKVLNQYRQEFIKKNPFYYPDRSVSRKSRKRFGGLWKLFAGIGIGYWLKSLF